jgi:hypothetical protein
VRADLPVAVSGGEAAPSRPQGGVGAGASARLAALALLGLALWLFREAVFGGGVLYKRDIHLVWHPQIEAFARAVVAGSWPLWDPGPAFGQPLLADPAAQILYPLTWLSLLLRPWWYYTLFAVVHVVGSSLAVYALCRHWKVSREGSLLAAAVWMLSGPFLSLIDLWHHFAGACWIPLVTLAADIAFESRRARPVLYLGLALGAQVLAGSADMCAMTFLLLAGLALARHLRGPWSSRRALALRAATAYVLALGLSAGLWLPALDVLTRSARRSLPLAVRTYWSVHPLGLLETLLPGLWSSLPLRADWRALLFESREPFLSSLYLGLPALGLVGAAAAAARPSLRRLLLAVLGAALLLALGRHTPAYDIALTLLPPLKILRYPVKAMALAAFAWALLAGLGYDVWRDPRSASPRRWTLLVVAPAALLLLLDLGLVLSLHFQPAAWSARLLDPALTVPSSSPLAATEAKLAVGAALALVLVVLSLLPRRPPALAAGLALLAVTELALYHRHPVAVAPVALYTHRPEVLSALGPGSATRVYVYDYSLGKSGGPGEKESELRALERVPAGWTLDAASALGMQLALAPQTAGRWGLRSGFEIDYRGLHPEPLRRMTLALRQVEGTAGQTRLLELGGITHVVASHPEAFEALTPGAVFPGLFKGPIRVFQVPDPRPRTYAVGNARIAPDPEGLPALLDPSFDPRHEVVLPEGLPARALASFSGSSRVVQDRPDRVLLEADLSEPGFVVLVDSYDPGWQAWLDGGPTRVLRANTAFRAVQVPGGRHRIEFVYRPWAVRLGIALAGISLASTVAALVVLRGESSLRQETS